MEKIEEVKKYVLENGITTVVHIAEQFRVSSNTIVKKFKTVKLGNLRFIVENTDKVNMEDPKIKTIICVLEEINKRIIEAKSQFIEVRPGSIAHKKCGRRIREITDVVLVTHEILCLIYGAIETTKRNHLRVDTSVKIRGAQTLIIETIKKKLTHSSAG